MSEIEWTDETWNPTIGCTKVTAGCDNCYMFREFPRLKAMKVPGYEASPDKVVLVESHLDKPLGWRKSRLVFVNSMSDLFHPSVPMDYISRCFAVMQATKQQGREHHFQVLTKRPRRAVAWWERQGMKQFNGEWPSHVWMGVSVEKPENLVRVAVLQRIPAAVRWVSAEPLLASLDLSDYLGDPLEWVVVGGESGPDARPMDLDWVRDIRAQCQNAGVPMFLKQLGGKGDKRGKEKALLDGEVIHEMPYIRSAELAGAV